MESENQKPLLIRIKDRDNVAIVVNEKGLKSGTLLDQGFALAEDVPQGHKVALKDFKEGEEVIRYGEVIGLAQRDIPKGGWIDEHAVILPKPPDLDELPLATRAYSETQPLEGYTFQGYRNRDGSVGTRNILGLMTSVQCVAGLAENAALRIKSELLRKYPNVDDVIAINHAFGCGIAVNAPETRVPIRTLQNLMKNPNLGGEAMVVGLGCEKLQPEELALGADCQGGDPDAATPIVTMQDESLVGFEAIMARIMELAEVKLQRLNQRRRETCPASDLVVGLQCGGSDAFSGITANPAVGFAADLIVRAGGSVMFSEVTEVRDAIHLLTPRAADEKVGRALLREMRWYDNYLAGGGADRSANPSPGNKKGGLANILEKSLGSVVKSGESRIEDVLSAGERIRRKGLTFAATPAGDFVCGTLQLASGMNVEVFTTGRGSPYALAMAPVIKVVSRSALARRWFDLMDLDAGRIATGEATIEEVGWELFRMILEVASGAKPAADKLGLVNQIALFNPAPVT